MVEAFPDLRFKRDRTLQRVDRCWKDPGDRGTFFTKRRNNFATGKNFQRGFSATSKSLRRIAPLCDRICFYLAAFDVAALPKENLDQDLNEQESTNRE